MVADTRIKTDDAKQAGRSNDLRGINFHLTALKISSQQAKSSRIKLQQAATAATLLTNDLVGITV